MSGKKKNGRFVFGVAGVALVVTYLMWTGVSESMMYYMTPVELMASAQGGGSGVERTIQVAGKLVPGTHKGEHGNKHTFVVADFERADVTIPVEFTGSLPDTFRPNEPDVEVVAKGRLREDGVFVATSVVTKCGSRYEASEADALRG